MDRIEETNRCKCLLSSYSIYHKWNTIITIASISFSLTHPSFRKVTVTIISHIRTDWLEKDNSSLRPDCLRAEETVSLLLSSSIILRDWSPYPISRSDARRKQHQLPREWDESKENRSRCANVHHLWRTFDRNKNSRREKEKYVLFALFLRLLYRPCTWERVRYRRGGGWERRCRENKISSKV